MSLADQSSVAIPILKAIATLSLEIEPGSIRRRRNTSGHLGRHGAAEVSLFFLGRQEVARPQHAACAARFRILIGLERNGCPWICRPDLTSAFAARVVRKTTGVLCNVGSDSIRAATSPPSQYQEELGRA